MDCRCTELCLQDATAPSRWAADKAARLVPVCVLDGWLLDMKTPLPAVDEMRHSSPSHMVDTPKSAIFAINTDESDVTEW
jgi:hypothetical protein